MNLVLVCRSSSLCSIMPCSRFPSTLSCLPRHHHMVQCHLQTSLIQVRPFSHHLSTHPSGVRTGMGLRPALGVVRPPLQSCCSSRLHSAPLFCIPDTCLELAQHTSPAHLFPLSISYAVVCVFRSINAAAQQDSACTAPKGT